MIWKNDPATQNAAQKFPLPIRATTPIKQPASETQFEPDHWQQHLLPGDTFPPGAKGYITPTLIIDEFKKGHYLPALALTIHWGGMTRQKTQVYGQNTIQHLTNIHNTLHQCGQHIYPTQDIQQAWDLLTIGLQWSYVMTSKTLHFLCRALGFTQDPPVPIDGRVIIERVWPRFRRGIPRNQQPKPRPWRGKGFSAYSRYMTAIREWTQAKSKATNCNWTTTDLEATIYEENR